MPVPAEPLLVVQDLCLSYGSTDALRGATLRCRQGITSLVGINGAGKTSLLRVLATLQRATGGTAQIFGLDVHDRSSRREIRALLGYVPQAATLPGHLTPLEVVEYMAWLHGVPRFRRRVATVEALERCRLTEFRNRKIRHLSGGTTRRVVLAQAIVHGPRLLLLDEPTVGLDPEQRIGFRALLREIAPDTVTVVSTHLMEDVAHTADAVVVLEQGRCVYTGSVAELAELGDDPKLLGDSALERGFQAARLGLGASA